MIWISSGPTWLIIQKWQLSKDEMPKNNCYQLLQQIKFTDRLKGRNWFDIIFLFGSQI